MREKDVIFQVTRESDYEDSPIPVILTRSRTKAMFFCIQASRKESDVVSPVEIFSIERLSYDRVHEEFVRDELETMWGYRPTIDNIEELANIFDSVGTAGFSSKVSTSLKVSTKDIFLGYISMEFPIEVSPEGGISTITSGRDLVYSWKPMNPRTYSNELRIRNLVFDGVSWTNPRGKRLSNIFREDVERRYRGISKIFEAETKDEMLLSYSSLGISQDKLEDGKFQLP